MTNEAVILYVNDEFASISRPNKQVRGFQKIHLEPQESKEVELQLTVEDLEFTDQHDKRVYLSGYFNVYIGNQKKRLYLRDSTPNGILSTTTNGFTTTSTPSKSASILEFSKISVFLALFFLFLF